MLLSILNGEMTELEGMSEHVTQSTNDYKVEGTVVVDLAKLS